MLYESIDTNSSGTKTLTEGVRARPRRRRALTRRGGISGLLIFVPAATADEGAMAAPIIPTTVFFCPNRRTFYPLNTLFAAPTVIVSADWRSD